jgi:integrase
VGSSQLTGWKDSERRDGRRDPKEKIAPLVCRFHDLRHTAVSRMLNAGIPIAKVAKIVGWSPATMVRMAARYGHFSLNDLRGAVESISGAELKRVPGIFPGIGRRAKITRAN